VTGESAGTDDLTRRTRELDVIQALGRRAAGAHRVDELIAATLVALRPVVPLELALVTHALSGAPACAAHTARPFRGELLDELAARSARVLQWTETPPVRVEPLGDHDPTLAARDRVDEAELATLPLERRGRVVGCLLVVLPRNDDRAATERLLFSAANQLSLHLERILAAREDEAQRFRTILDSMPQAVLLTDADWRVRQANRAADALFRALELPLEHGLEAARARLELDGLAARLREEGAGVVEGEAHPARDRVVTVTASPLVEEGHGEHGLVLVLTDVTERRRLQEQLAQSEKMSSLGLMISGVAHELNNPLTSILGYAQLLGMGTGNEEQRTRRAELLRRETERCQRIVHNLLSFARQRGPERGPLSLNEVVQAVLALMGYQLRVSDIEVRVELDADLRSVHGDRHQLQQVLVNLISNAHHAIRDQGGGGTITVRTVAAPLSSRLEVEDSGPGIPEESRGRIFDRFFTTKSEGQGTGLGLSLVSGIVTSHGGSVEALAGRETGALFRVELPASAARSARAEERSRPDGSSAGRPGQVLVVDDEETLARMVAEGLTEEGHEVRTAHSGREALDLISRESFDVIIADVRMPGMDGARLYEELRRSRPDLASRFVLTSGDTLGGDAEAAARHAGVDLLRKPFDLARLRDTVSACMIAPPDE
jgi:two-component system NtrC family sensor kinase